MSVYPQTTLRLQQRLNDALRFEFTSTSAPTPGAVEAGPSTVEEITRRDWSELTEKEADTPRAHGTPPIRWSEISSRRSTPKTPRIRPVTTRGRTGKPTWASKPSLMTGMKHAVAARGHTPDEDVRDTIETDNDLTPVRETLKQCAECHIPKPKYLFSAYRSNRCMRCIDCRSNGKVDGVISKNMNKTDKQMKESAMKEVEPWLDNWAGSVKGVPGFAPNHEAGIMKARAAAYADRRIPELRRVVKRDAQKISLTIKANAHATSSSPSSHTERFRPQQPLPQVENARQTYNNTNNHQMRVCHKCDDVAPLSCYISIARPSLTCIHCRTIVKAKAACKSFGGARNAKSKEAILKKFTNFVDNWAKRVVDEGYVVSEETTNFFKRAGFKQMAKSIPNLCQEMAAVGIYDYLENTVSDAASEHETNAAQVASEPAQSFRAARIAFKITTGQASNDIQAGSITVNIQRLKIFQPGLAQKIEEAVADFPEKEFEKLLSGLEPLLGHLYPLLDDIESLRSQPMLAESTETFGEYIGQLTPLVAELSELEKRVDRYFGFLRNGF